MVNKVLGKGLSALISDKPKTTAPKQALNIEYIDVSKIKGSSYQPRENFSENQLNELAASIKEKGILQPLILRQTNQGYELIAGERRLRSARILKLPTVPVIVRDTKEQEMLEIALIENIQRENLNPVETALSYQKLMNEFNLSQEDLSKRLGKPRPSIANTIRLLNLPNDIQQGLIEGKITESHAKLILGLDTEVKQMTLYRNIVHTGLSVNDAAHESRKMGGTKQARVQPNLQDQDKEQKLRTALGTKVEIRRKSKGGQIVVDFYSDEELSGLMGKLVK